MKRPFSPFFFVLFLACSFSSEGTKIRIPVTADSSEIRPVETDLGYEVELTEAGAFVRDLRFLSAEARSELLRPMDLLVRSARAHPGHLHGGEVTGELLGRFGLRWLPNAGSLGEATLLPGPYVSASYGFAPAEESDGLVETSPLLGKAAHLRGRATKGEAEVPFVVLLDPPEGRLEHVPFEATVGEGSPTALGLRLRVEDAGGTLFDGIDFQALASGAPSPLSFTANAPDPAVKAAHERLRNAFFSHRFHEVRALHER
jgi:hypothetical protein